MTTSAYILCVIGVGAVTAQIMKVILWLDEPKQRRKKAAQWIQNWVLNCDFLVWLKCRKEQSTY